MSAAEERGGGRGGVPKPVGGPPAKPATSAPPPAAPPARAERPEVIPPGRGRLVSGAPPRPATRAQRLGLIFGLLAALLFALWLFSAILTPFVLAACIAYFLDPPATKLARIGLRRGVGAFLLILALFALGLVAMLILYPLLIAQAGILAQRLPAYVTGIGAAVREALLMFEERFGSEVLDSRLRELAVGQAGAMLTFLATAVARMVSGGVALFNVFTLVVVTPIVAFYLLRDWPRLLGRMESWLPRRSAATIRQLARDTDRVLSAWLRGQLLCCAALGVFYAIGLSAVGLELGTLVGLMAGLLSFIPYVGSMTGFVTAMTLALAQFGSWSEVLAVLAVFVTGQVLEGYVIYPRLLGNRVELHAVWVIFALFAGGVAFGFLGVLLAVPMAAAVGVVARYWLRRYLESPLYLDPPRTGT